MGELVDSSKQNARHGLSHAGRVFLCYHLLRALTGGHKP